MRNKKKSSYEAMLVEQAFRSARKQSNPDSLKQRKYEEIKEKIALDKPTMDSCKENKDACDFTSEATESSYLWDIGFTPNNFANLVELSGAKSNTDFFKTYGISKTVFYSYLRGDASPTYNNWLALISDVAKRNKSEGTEADILKRLDVSKNRK